MIRKTTTAKCLAAALIAGAIASGGAAFANPTGVTYKVRVTTSFGTKFTDCFAFDGAGNLTVSGYGPLVYTLGGFGKDVSRFMSVSTLAEATNAGFAIAFNGQAFGTPKVGWMNAIGMDEQGDSYEIHGGPDATCAPPSAAQGSRYVRPQ
jgi:hypothetical protein